jgi:hypothetical protein
MAITGRQRLVIGYSISGSRNGRKILINKPDYPVEIYSWHRSVLDTDLRTATSSVRIAKRLLHYKLNTTRASPLVGQPKQTAPDNQ